MFNIIYWVYFLFFFPPGQIFINVNVLYLIAEPAQAKYNCFTFNQLLRKNMIVLYLTRLATPRAVGRRTSWGELLFWFALIFIQITKRKANNPISFLKSKVPLSIPLLPSHLAHLGFNPHMVGKFFLDSMWSYIYTIIHTHTYYICIARWASGTSATTRRSSLRPGKSTWCWQRQWQL